MRNLTTEEVSVFTYEEWLSRTRGPKRTMICEMAAVVDEEMMVELTTYIIQVKTSDIAGTLSICGGYCQLAHKPGSSTDWRNIEGLDSLGWKPLILMVLLILYQIICSIHTVTID